MLETKDGAKYSGKFKVDGRDIDGELTFAREGTELLLHHPEFFAPDNIQDECILGVLRDRTRVSLLQSLAPSIPDQHRSTSSESYESAVIRPHYIVHGERHVRPKDRSIRSIAFTLKHPSAVFPDYGSFSYIHTNDDKSVMNRLFAEQTKYRRKLSETHGYPHNTRQPESGKWPIISFFSGQRNIFRATTEVGTISAVHMPSARSGGPDGVAISNKICTKIAFNVPVTFMESMGALVDALSFLAIIAGRRQEVETLEVGFGNQRRQANLSVYWCYPPRRTAKVERSPRPYDLPLNVIESPTTFSLVFATWISRHSEWKSARSRFLSSFTQENEFDLDRLIGSANMFDLLPATAAPNSTALSDELANARNKGLELFKALPRSAERDSVLGALSRMDKATLKRKIRHRALIVTETLGPKLPHLADILDLAVDARNHFVHGTETKINYLDHFFETIAFFCNALEFVFAMSDLSECGLNLESWSKQATSFSHPLPTFLYNYRSYLARLQEILPAGHRLKGVVIS